MARSTHPPSRHSRGHTAGIVGVLLGLAAAGTAAGVAVTRVAGRRVRAAELGPAADVAPELTPAQLRVGDPLGSAAGAADRAAPGPADHGGPRSREEGGPRDPPPAADHVPR